MSISMKRAMGWAMTWSDFEMATTLECEGHETGDALEAAMSRATVADLTVPMDHRNALFYAEKRPRLPMIFDPVLLALDLEFEGEGDQRARSHPGGFGRPDDLYALVMNPDEVTHVMFWPTAQDGRSNFRRANIMDSYFEQYRDGATDDGGMRDFVTWMRFNPYPHGNNLMVPETGAPLEWDSFWRLDKTYPDGWAPSVPSELRWWLPKLGILDEAGTLKLRPALAQWWC